MSSNDRKVRGNVAVLRACSALSLTATMARPVGSMKPLRAETQASTPHSSIRKSIEASEDTASTNSSAGCLAASRARRTPAMSDVTPVAVSLWQASTALMRWRVSADPLILLDRHTLPHSTSSAWTSRSWRRRRSAHKCRELAEDRAQHLVTRRQCVGDGRLHPAVPEPGKMNTWPLSS